MIMKVRELITQLRLLDQDAIVIQFNEIDKAWSEIVDVGELLTQPIRFYKDGKYTKKYGKFIVFGAEE